MSKAVKLKNSLYLASTSIVHKRGGGWYYLNNLLDNIYPVGSIFISTVNTNPSTYFGGTWERIKGRFLLAADDSTYTLGATGGSAAKSISHQHNLSANGGARIGLVSGNMYYNRNWVGDSIKYNQTITNFSFDHVNDGAYTGNLTSSLTGKTDSGGSTSLNIMPPYLVVYIWKRVS